MTGQDQCFAGERGEQAVLDRADDRREISSFELGGTWPAREKSVAAEQDRLVRDLEAHGPWGVAGGENGFESQPAHLDHIVVGEDFVVAGQHGGVLLGHVHGVSGVSKLGHGLNVVPMAVGLENLANPEPLTEFKESFVLVGGVDQHGIAAVAASKHVNVVGKIPNNNHVNLGVGVRPDEGVHPSSLANN